MAGAGRNGWIIGLIATLTLAGSGGAQTTDAGEGQRRLSAAKAAAAAADRRAAALAAAASQERDAAERAAAEERALAGKVAAKEAALATARARAQLVEALLAQQRARLARIQAPAAHLLAALESLARRPAALALAQPGSINDMVHVRAVLGSALPAVRARAQGLRVELARARVLAGDARLAADALRQSRAALEGERTRLAELEAAHRARAGALGRDAMSEQDRALALGERARDLVDRMALDDRAAATAGDLASLPGPIMRPIEAVRADSRLDAAYRLPVVGRVLTGFGEVSPDGVRSRGLTLGVRPGAPVSAPAGGVVRFAQTFRVYGRIVIIDHGAGWTTLLTGLGALSVRPGTMVGAGTVVGRAPTGDNGQVTIELRRRGRPVDLSMLLG